MTLLRAALSAVTAFLLVGGYFASQYAYFVGSTGAYVRALDGSAVPLVSLVLLVSAVVLCVVPAKGEDS